MSQTGYWKITRHIPKTLPQYIRSLSRPNHSPFLLEPTGRCLCLFLFMTNSPKQPTDCLEKEAKLVDCSETEMYFFAIFFNAAPHLPSKQNYKIEIHLHRSFVCSWQSLKGTDHPVGERRHRKVVGTTRNLSARLVATAANSCLHTKKSREDPSKSIERRHVIQQPANFRFIKNEDELVSFDRSKKVSSTKIFSCSTIWIFLPW